MANTWTEMDSSVKQVALVNPNRLWPGVAPVALDYLAAELDRRGIGVQILDLCHIKRPLDAIRSFLSENSPDLIGVSIRNMDDVVYNCFLAREMKTLVDEIKRCTNAPIVLGGSGFSIAPELMLDFFDVDLGVVGEGEQALCLLSDLSDSSDLSDVPGLIRRTSAGIQRNPLGCADAGCLHVSKRGWIQHWDYITDCGKKGSAGVQTKRGCPNRCIYCVVPNIEGRTVRQRDPKDIAQEIENLAAAGVKRIFLADSEFNYPLEHAMGVCEEIIARGLPGRVTWQAYASPGNFDVRLAKLMKEAGCDLLITTIDSGDDSMLERLGKPFRTEDTITTIRAIQEAGLNAPCCLTLGGPGETMETLLKTLQFAKSLKPARVTWGEPPGLRIYPDTPLADIVREEGFTPSNRNLRGKIRGNEDFLEPVYYMSAGMGVLIPVIQAWRKIGEWHHRLVAGKHE